MCTRVIPSIVAPRTQIGLGHIGCAVAEDALALGMTFPNDHGSESVGLMMSLQAITVAFYAQE